MRDSLLTKLNNVDLYDLALRLTLVDLILRPVGSTEIRVPILVAAVIGLVIPKILRNAALWFLLTGITLTRVIADWPLSDNHAYLLFIWCFAIFISALRKDEVMLAKNAKLMIGLVFAFAFIWKVLLSADYLDGRFFSFAMIEDGRFSEFTQLVCNINKDDLYDFRDYITQHVDGQLLHTIPIQFNIGCVNKVSGFITYYTLLLELLVSIMFLFPRKLKLSIYRDYFLILFCISIYSVATVEGFGWLLIAMGVCQSNNKRLPILLYNLSFLMILFYREVSVAGVILDNF